MAKAHYFDPELAAAYGLEEAIVIRRFQYQILSRRDSEEHQHDGRTWYAHTYASLAKDFPYLSVSKVRYIVTQLLQKKVLVKRPHTGSFRDPQNWFAFVDENRFLEELNPLSKMTSDKNVTCENRQVSMSKTTSSMSKMTGPYISVGSPLASGLEEGEYVNAERAERDTPPPQAAPQKVRIDQPTHGNPVHVADQTQPGAATVQPQQGGAAVERLSDNAGTSCGAERGGSAPVTRSLPTGGGAGNFDPLADYERRALFAANAWQVFRDRLAEAVAGERRITRYTQDGFCAALGVVLGRGDEYTAALADSILWHVTDYYRRQPNTQRNISETVMATAVQDAADSLKYGGKAAATSAPIAFPKPIGPPVPDGVDPALENLRRMQAEKEAARNTPEAIARRQRLDQLAAMDADHPEWGTLTRFERLEAQMWRKQQQAQGRVSATH